MKVFIHKCLAAIHHESTTYLNIERLLDQNILIQDWSSYYYATNHIKCVEPIFMTFIVQNTLSSNLPQFAEPMRSTQKSLPVNDFFFFFLRSFFFVDISFPVRKTSTTYIMYLYFTSQHCVERNSLTSPMIIQYFTFISMLRSTLENSS